jgi:hypothetical protein
MILTVGCLAHAEYQVALSIEIAVVGVVVSISPIALLTGPDIPIKLFAVELIVKHQFPALSRRFRGERSGHAKHNRDHKSR